MYTYESDYFGRLDMNERDAYKKMRDGLLDYANVINLDNEFTVEEMKRIYEYILFDNPRIFYVAHEFQVSNGVITQFVPKYTYTKWKAKKLNAKIDKYLEKMKEEFKQMYEETDLAKERFVHDYCLRNFSYDHKLKKVSHTVMGLILNKKGVCDGISKFCKLVLNYLGVNALVVSGEGRDPSKSKDEAHAWNIVELDRYWYHLDVTYNMTLSDKLNRYDYYNLADCDIMRDHIINDIVPVCNIGGSYFEHEDLVARNFNELKYIIDRHVKGRAKAHFSVKLLGNAFTDNIVNEVMKCALERYQKNHLNNVEAKINVRYNARQMVFEILIQPKTWLNSLLT